MDSISFFVADIFKRKQSDTAFSAALKRADNENLEWKAWEYLYKYIPDLNNEVKRKSFSLIAASIAKSSMTENGTIRLGRAMKLVSGTTNDTEYSPRFMRLLSCESLDELIDILRQTLSLVRSKGISFDYVSLLYDLLGFSNPEKQNDIKAHWAMDFLKKVEV